MKCRRSLSFRGIVDNSRGQRRGQNGRADRRRARFEALDLILMEGAALAKTKLVSVRVPNDVGGCRLSADRMGEGPRAYIVPAQTDEDAHPHTARCIPSSLVCAGTPARPCGT